MAEKVLLFQLEFTATFKNYPSFVFCISPTSALTDPESLVGGGVMKSLY